MDNQTHDSENAQAAWIEDRLASLVPSGEWHPDSNRALSKLMKRQDLHEAGGSPRWVGLTMVAAVVVSIGLVVSLLPWRTLWGGKKEGKNVTLSEPQKAATPAVVPEPTQAPPAPNPPVRSQPPVAATAAAIQQTAPPAPEQEQKPAVRVEPGVTAPQTISPMPEPVYTDEARQAHIQGAVVLSVIIRADGTGKVDKVVRGLGYGLDEKAIEAFEKWRFTPGMVDGKPVNVQLEVVINFHLY